MSGSITLPNFNSYTEKQKQKRIGSTVINPDTHTGGHMKVTYTPCSLQHYSQNTVGDGNPKLPLT